MADPDSSRISLRLALDSARSVVPTFLAFGIPIFALLFPLLVWPGLAQPFSSPKLLAWSLVTSLFGVVVLTAQRQRTSGVSTAAVVSLSLLIACVGISAGLGVSADVDSLLLVITGLAWFALLGSTQTRVYPLCMALVGAASVISVVSLFQLAGADPFQLAGWLGVGGANPRMRVYATLGNPNFVGAFLAGVLPVTIATAFHAPRARRIVAMAALLQGMAIAATGSRAAAVGALVSCGLVSVDFARSRRWLGLALCASLALPVLGLTQARPLLETVQGRLFVWRVAVPQLSTIPAFGFGPGAFEEQFEQWQQEYLRAGTFSADQRFAARFDHAHNDLLEWTVEYGWAGLAALAGCLGVFLFVTGRGGRASPTARAASAGACGLVLIALVDFPFHRPEGLFLLATLAALACAGSHRQSSPAQESKLHGAKPKEEPACP